MNDDARKICEDLILVRQLLYKREEKFRVCQTPMTDNEVRDYLAMSRREKTLEERLKVIMCNQ